MWYLYCTDNFLFTPFPHDNLNGFTAIKSILGVYIFFIDPWGSLFVWGRDLDFQGHRGRKGKIRFLEHNSKSFSSISLILGTDTCLRSGKMLIHFWGHWDRFWVSECERSKFAPRGISGPTLWCYFYRIRFQFSFFMETKQKHHAVTQKFLALVYM